jgi:hypothetical protein
LKMPELTEAEAKTFTAQWLKDFHDRKLAPAPLLCLPSRWWLGMCGKLNAALLLALRGPKRDA